MPEKNQSQMEDQSKVNPVSDIVESPLYSSQAPKRNWMKIGLIAIGALLIVSLIPAAYYFGASKSSETSNDSTQASSSATPSPTPTSTTNPDPSPTPSPDPYENWKAFDHSHSDVTFKYPADWDLVVEENASSGKYLLVDNGIEVATFYAQEIWGCTGPGPDNIQYKTFLFGSQSLKMSSAGCSTGANEYEGILSTVNPESNIWRPFIVNFLLDGTYDAELELVAKSFTGVTEFQKAQ